MASSIIGDAAALRRSGCASASGKKRTPVNVLHCMMHNPLALGASVQGSRPHRSGSPSRRPAPHVGEQHREEASWQALLHHALPGPTSPEQSTGLDFVDLYTMDEQDAAVLLEDAAAARRALASAASPSPLHRPCASAAASSSSSPSSSASAVASHSLQRLFAGHPHHRHPHATHLQSHAHPAAHQPGPIPASIPASPASSSPSRRPAAAPATSHQPSPLAPHPASAPKPLNLRQLGTFRDAVTRPLAPTVARGFVAAQQAYAASLVLSQALALELYRSMEAGVAGSPAAAAAFVAFAPVPIRVLARPPAQQAMRKGVRRGMGSAAPFWAGPGGRVGLGGPGLAAGWLYLALLGVWATAGGLLRAALGWLRATAASLVAGPDVERWAEAEAEAALEGGWVAA